MSIEEVREINHKWDEILLQDVKDDLLEADTIWDYEPFSDDYWNQKTKIVLCNFEQYGYVEKKDGEDRRLTFEKYSKYTNQAIKYSSLFIYCLYKKLQGENINKEQLHALYDDNKEKVLSVVKNITYMNLRKDENLSEGDVNAEVNTVRNYYEKGKLPYKGYPNVSNECNREFLRDFIEALEPDIFIISHEYGYKILNDVYEGKINLQWQNSYKYKKTLFVSIKHPAARIDYYQYIVERTAQIVDDYIKVRKAI